MTNASIKAIVSLTRSLRPSSFGTLATKVAVHELHGLCAFREAQYSLRRNFRSAARKREKRRVIQIPT